jgi:anion-transporting  ArsA/GET3 family ATPase
VAGFGATAFMKVAGRVTGMELLDDLAMFFRNFEGMYEGFKERAEQVLALLQEPSSQFVVVTSPEPPPLREAHYFLERLEQEGLHAAGVVVNRIRPVVADEPDDEALTAAAAAQDDATEGRAVAGTLRLLRDVRHLAHRQRRDVAAALYGIRVRVQVEVPLLGRDVHDLEGLDVIADTLTAGRRPA